MLGRWLIKNLYEEDRDFSDVTVKQIAQLGDVNYVKKEKRLCNRKCHKSLACCNTGAWACLVYNPMGLYENFRPAMGVIHQNLYNAF